MKRILIITTFLLIAAASYAQDTKFTGIGIFKIGSDTTTLYSFASDNKIKIGIMNDEMKFITASYGNSKKTEFFFTS